ncbi:MAG: flagellar basal body L-ring protein FlgH [Desulfovibrionaceae bacterium]
MHSFSKHALCLLSATLLLLPACQGSKKRPVIQPPIVPAQEFNETAKRNNPGSLYAESDIDPLFSDSRARRVGDIVVVKIIETTKAKNKADTSTSKTNTNGYGVGANFGYNNAAMFPIVGAGPTGPVGKGNLIFDSTSNSALSVTGETKRENNVTSSIAARVLRVMPGGILQIEGAREIRVNEETQYMVVTGTIRTRDVAADNSIMSTQMADASIQYYGKGVLADKQKPGWFTRLMDNIWPF